MAGELEKQPVSIDGKRQRNNQIEKEISYRLGFKNLIISIGIRFINLDVSKIDEYINKALEEIGKFVDADRSYILKYYNNLEMENNTHEWCSEGIEPQIDKLQGVSVLNRAKCIKTLKRLEVFHEPKVKNLSPEDNELKSILLKQGIKSIIMVPMLSNGVLIGALGFDSVRKERIWSEDAVNLLKIVGEIFVNTLDRKHTEEHLKKALEEKAVLLKELNHRVNNNLSIIESLINIQIENIKDAEYKNIFKGLSTRIHSISLVHEKLYQNENFSKLNIEEYLKDIIGYLLYLVEEDRNKIKLHFYVEKIYYRIDSIVSIGLIVNELVTNTLKHAFPDGRSGILNIELKKRHGNNVLILSDNGVGIPDNITLENNISIGLNLVVSLTRQLHGTINLNRDKGTKFIIEFPD